jgi:hypothetical protein
LAQLTGTGAAEGKFKPVIFNEAMYLIQKVGHFLDLVNDHPGVSGDRLKLIGKISRLGHETIPLSFIQEVDEFGFGELTSKPSAFTGTSGTEKKKGFFRTCKGSCIIHGVNLHKNIINLTGARKNAIYTYENPAKT